MSNMDLKISELPVAQPLNGNDLIPVVQDTGNGTLETRKGALAQVLNLNANREIVFKNLLPRQ